jgi:outer membrane protein
MKKLQVLAVVAVLMLAGSASAQTTKIGYIRIDDIVGLFPELSSQKVNMDTVGQKYIQDSVLPRYNFLQSEYTRKIQELNDTVKNSKAVREQYLKELQNDKQELDGFNDVVQQVQQYKQQQLLKPYYEKAKKAIDAVAKKKGYTHILSTDIFLVAPEADDISLAVLAELNIKVPAANAPGALNPGAARPAGTKPAGN